MASVGGATTPASEKFEEAKFMKELINLKETQDAVQCLSGWCIRNRKFSYKIARCWLKCAKKGNFICVIFFSKTINFSFENVVDFLRGHS